MVPVIVGPTASGKSALAMRIAESVSGIEIVSADSRQIYRRLDIGTAKPPPADLAAVPHHMIDVVQPTEAYSAGRFAEAAREAIRGILGRGGRPLVVGGAGFYVSALFEGLAAPAASQETYARLEERMRDEGYDRLLAELRVVDPVAASAHSPNNRAKTLRALACYLETGRRYSEFMLESASRRFEHAPQLLGIAPPRPHLYERINARVHEMVTMGLVEETRGVLDDGIPEDAPGLRTVGYVEAIAYLKRSISHDRMIEDIQLATRRYAKRQMTWFRRYPDVTWITPGLDITGALRWD